MPSENRRVPERFRVGSYFGRMARPTLQVPESYLRRLRENETPGEVLSRELTFAVDYTMIRPDGAIDANGAQWRTRLEHEMMSIRYVGGDNLGDGWVSVEAVHRAERDREAARQVAMERQRYELMLQQQRYMTRGLDASVLWGQASPPTAIPASFWREIMGSALGGPPAGMTPEQYEVELARQREQQAEHRRRLLEAQRREQEQIERDYKSAEALLFRMISPEQQTQYTVEGHVDETAPSGRRWRLYGQMMGGVFLLNDDDDEWRVELCVHPEGRLPKPALIAGLLMNIRTNEAAVIATANLMDGILTQEEWELRDRPDSNPCPCAACRAVRANQ